MGAQNPNCCQDTCDDPKELPTLVGYQNELMFCSKHSSRSQLSPVIQLEQTAKEFCHKNNISEFYVPMISKIITYPHQNLFMDKWSKLSEHQRSSFLQNLNDIKLELMDELYHYFSDENEVSERIKSKLMYSYPPEVLNERQQNIEKINFYVERGYQLLKNQKVALVLMCAGSPSRFEEKQSKLSQSAQSEEESTILDNIFNNLKESLRQIKSIPIIISCNNQNIEDIKSQLQSKKYFGIPENSFKFILSSSLVVLDNDGKYCLNQHFSLIKRAPGTAECAQALFSEEMEEYFKTEHIQYVYFSGMENLKEKPCDPLLLGQMVQKNRKVGVKCTQFQPVTQNEPNQIFPWYYLGMKVDHEDSIWLLHTEQLQSFPYKLNTLRYGALNSLAFELKQLRKIVYNLQKDLSQPQIYYLMKKQEMILSSTGLMRYQTCLSFQRDIRGYLSCTEDPLLLCMDINNSYTPLHSSKKKYSTTSHQVQYVKNEDL